METETESKKQQQWENPISPSSSSRSSSITSDSSDGHFVLRHFPLPKPSISASEAQKQREIYNSGQLFDLPGYDPNRIPSSVFSSKPGNSTKEWSIASNESLFSIHDVNFGIKEDRGFRLSEIPKFEEPVHEISEFNAVPLPLPLSPVEKSDQEEKLDSEIDDGEEEGEKMIEIESEEEAEEMIEPLVSVEIEIEKPVFSVDEDVKEINKPEDLISTSSHSPSISCRSDTSNNSTCSFAFPVLQKDGITKSPSMEIRGDVSYKLSHKRRPQYQLPQPPKQPLQPKPQPSESSTLAQPQSQRKASKKFESQTQSPKASKRSLFSCFHCPKKCGLFK